MKETFLLGNRQQKEKVKKVKKKVVTQNTKISSRRKYQMSYKLKFAVIKLCLTFQ